ncbi:MAG: hypothetical protein ABI624_15955 [Casimicrobiaceae bacterium]
MMQQKGIAFPLIAVAGIALFGNGLKAIVSSSVLVSEAQFAEFMRISLEHTGLLMESIMAGMVIALGVCPILLQRISPRTLGIGASAIAAAAFAAFGAVEMAQPGGWARELAVFACFTLGAGALACLAPASQALIASATIAVTARGPMTTVWTGAAPAGFLAAPQLVKFVLPLLGLGGYFLAFSVFPVVVLVLLVLVVYVQSPEHAATAGDQLPTRVLLSFVSVVAAFELWSTLGSLNGYVQPATWAGLAVLAACLALFARSLRNAALPATALGNSRWLLAALFLLELPTTGFFDTAYLFGNGMTQGFVADRSTLAAASQIAGTVLAGVLRHGRPAREWPLLVGATAITIAGIVAIAAYPWLGDDRAWFLLTPALQGFGVGALTGLLVLAVMRDAVAHPVLAALPSLAILFGTEFGLEVLQLVFAAARAVGQDVHGAYATVFAVEVLLALALPVVLAIARLRRVDRDVDGTPGMPADAAHR